MRAPMCGHVEAAGDGCDVVVVVVFFLKQIQVMVLFYCASLCAWFECALAPIISDVE